MTMAAPLWLLACLLLLVTIHPMRAASVACGSVDKCTATETSALCYLDDDANCIRKSPSKCHLDVTACKMGKNITDVSGDYCMMDSFFCEDGNERWTIFFGSDSR